MRLFVKITDAAMVCAGDNQYPVKGQVVDVPDELGTSLLSFPEYDAYNGQVPLDDDFRLTDKAANEAAEKARKESEKVSKKVTNGGALET